MKYGQYPLSLVALAIVIFASSATAQDERLSLEWVFSEEGKTATSRAMPRIDGRAKALIALPLGGDFVTSSV